MRVSTIEGKTAICRWPVHGSRIHANVGLFGLDLLVVDRDDGDPERGVPGA